MSKSFRSKIFWVVIILIIISITIYFFNDMRQMRVLRACGALGDGKKACVEYKCKSDNFWIYIPRNEVNIAKGVFGGTPICSDGSEAIRVN